MATTEIVVEQWVMKFDGSSTTNSGEVGVVLYHSDEATVALSFKLEFLCSNNIVEYEAYLMGLATTLEMGIKHLRVIGESNLVICQAKGSFSLKEPSLAPYKMLAQRMEEKFCTFEIEHVQRSENRYADVLAILGSQIAFEGSSTRVEVKKQREFIIEVIKEKFPKKEECRLEGSHQGSPIEGRRCGRTENRKGLCPNERRTVLQNVRRNSIKMCWARGGLEKAKRSA